MGNFKINFGVVMALLVIVGVVYFAYNAVQTETFSGETLNVTTSGVIKVSNPSADPVVVNTTARRIYTITLSGAANSTVRPTREGSGRSLAHIAEIELPPGETLLSVTRGEDVSFQFTAPAPIEAVVGARDDAGNRNIILLAAAVSIAAVGYMSFATQHSWLKLLRSRSSGKSEDMTVSPA